MRHGRARRTGFAVGQYLQPPPMLFTRDGHNLFLGDMYRGSAAFLICSGPSLLSHDLAQLALRGVLTMAVNNAAAVVRPNLWISTDDPGNFCDAIWRDPAITKFAPLCHMEKPVFIRDEIGALAPSEELVGDMPAVFGYRRNEAFNAEQWLNEDSFNWGNHGDRVDDYGEKGSRSVMYVALRMLHYLGVRKVFLLGCDFRMEEQRQNYAFEQERSSSSVHNNNQTYRILNVRLAALQPFFREAGFEVFNCTPESGLTVFDSIDFDDAIHEATAGIPESICTTGMYDRKEREKTADQRKSVSTNSVPHDVREDGRLRIEIVSHCWRYSALLAYQLSSLAMHPPQTCSIRMTVCYSTDDVETCRVLERFGQLETPNVSWNWQAMEKTRLFRRAIGRNRAALTTTADWIWFCDCDYLFDAGFLDDLSEKLMKSEADLAYPCSAFVSEPQDMDSCLLEQTDHPKHLLDADGLAFHEQRFNRAIGGLQIVRGCVAREKGYCKDEPRFMRPERRWKRTFEDVRFRKTLGSKGQPVDVSGLYRIVHVPKGRLSSSVTL